MTAVTCRHPDCGREIIPCPAAGKFTECTGWVHADDSTHYCHTLEAADQAAAPAITASGFPVSGRSEPRPSGPPVAHEMRYAPVLALDEDGTTHAAISANCACGGYAVTMRESYYTHEQLTRLAVMHEQGRAS